jgi:hypothetical protein
LRDIFRSFGGQDKGDYVKIKIKREGYTVEPLYKNPAHKNT